MESVAEPQASPWEPDHELPFNPRDFKTPNYGLTSFADLFTKRQLAALTTFSDLVLEVRDRVLADARSAGMSDDSDSHEEAGSAATYADAVTVYLGIVMSRVLHYSSTLCTWLAKDSALARTFTKQALPMSWDFAEGNPFAKSSVEWMKCTKVIAQVVELLPCTTPSSAHVQDAATGNAHAEHAVISTDPPYYDNIGYADLSDFFYLWLRRTLKPVLPDLFTTVAVPKAEELVATPYRHGSKDAAEKFFLDGMTETMRRLVEETHPAFPITIYYAFKQAETRGDAGTASTGWETFLDAVIRAGFSITGTWPVRTEGDNRQISIGTNALASSIVLVCRPRASDALAIPRRDFVTALKAELPEALDHLQKSNIAPVDLAQAAIGPGMAVYTRYESVLESDGSSLSVRTALTLINQVLDEVLAEQEGDFDADSQWALAWFEQSGFDEGDYGIAETLSKAKNTSVKGLVDAGILASKGGKVRLLSPADLPVDWDPAKDSRLTVWEMVHHMIRVLTDGGEGAAAELAAKLDSQAEIARELAYRLYALCERKKRATEALAYNGLVQSWPEIARLVRERKQPRAEQSALFGETEG